MLIMKEKGVVSSIELLDKLSATEKPNYNVIIVKNGVAIVNPKLLGAKT
jgi:hypothetical protein